MGDKLLIDAWKAQPKATTYKGEVKLAANTRYDLQLELMHGTGNASAKLTWQTNTLVKQTVPSKLLAPRAASLQSKINHALAFARDRVAATRSVVLE